MGSLANLQLYSFEVVTKIYSLSIIDIEGNMIGWLQERDRWNENEQEISVLGPSLCFRSMIQSSLLTHFAEEL